MRTVSASRFNRCLRLARRLIETGRVGSSIANFALLKRSNSELALFAARAGRKRASARLSEVLIHLPQNDLQSNIQVSLS
jgi:hypothetical protein